MENKNLTQQEKIQKLSDLAKKNQKTEAIKAEIADILGDIPLKDKMQIAEEVKNNTKNSMDAKEIGNLQFIIPHIIHEFAEMTDEEKQRFLENNTWSTPKKIDEVVQPVNTVNTSTTDVIETPTTNTITAPTDTTTEPVDAKEKAEEGKLPEMIEVGDIKVPRVGFGMWTLNMIPWPQEPKETIKMAIQNGYRNFDTAQEYENEEELGNSIKESNIPRSEFFITTKISPSKKHFPNRNIQQKDAYDSVINGSLKNLKMDYVDLLLLHSPINNENIENNCLDAMIQLWEEWKTKHIGVSNFDVDQLKRANEYVKSKTGGKLSISCNQIEINCLLKDKTSFENVKKYADANKILVTGYSPLWSPWQISDYIGMKKITENATVKDIAAKYNITPHQLALAYVINKWVMVIPSSTQSKNQIWNRTNIFDIKISEEDMKKLDNIWENEGTKKTNINYFNEGITSL